MRTLLLAVAVLASPTSAGELPFPKLLANARARLDQAAKDASPECKSVIGEGVRSMRSKIDQLGITDEPAKFEQVSAGLGLLSKATEQCAPDLLQQLLSAKGWVEAAQSKSQPKARLPMAPICIKFVACSEALVPGMAETMASSYGKDGACWKATDASDSCVIACAKGLGNLAEVKEAFLKAEACR